MNTNTNTNTNTNPAERLRLKIEEASGWILDVLPISPNMVDVNDENGTALVFEMDRRPSGARWVLTHYRTEGARERYGWIMDVVAMENARLQKEHGAR